MLLDCRTSQEKRSLRVDNIFVLTEEQKKELQEDIKNIRRALVTMNNRSRTIDPQLAWLLNASFMRIQKQIDKLQTVFDQVADQDGAI